MSNKALTYWLVYHNTDPDTMFLPQVELWQTNNRDTYFRLVALVQATSPQEVYRLTNHIEYDWRENEPVKAVALQPQRSTSVGDVIVQSGNWQAWMVDHTGFKLLPWFNSPC
ncbi:MAG TPA: hypothetical protein VH186_03645 [Chloroflexia bacterium]|nr:hypothetical protein [Chloroflexia bacterium]